MYSFYLFIFQSFYQILFLFLQSTKASVTLTLLRTKMSTFITNFLGMHHCIPKRKMFRRMVCAMGQFIKSVSRIAPITKQERTSEEIA